MAKLVKRSCIAIMQEASQGTARTSTASDFIQVEGLDIEAPADIIKRDFARTYLDSVPDLIGKKYYTVKANIELKGNGGVDGTSLTAWGPLSAALESTGLTGGIAGSKTVFLPTSTTASSNFAGAGKSVTLEIYKDGIKHVVAGALSPISFTVEPAKRVLLNFEWKGLYQDPTEVATMPPTSPNAISPPIVQNSSLVVQSFNPVASKFEFKNGGKVQERLDVSSSAGIYGFQITSYDTSGSLEIEAPTVGAHNVFNRFQNGTTGSLSATLGNTAGNRVELYFPCVQYQAAKYGSQGEILTYQIPLKFNALTGNDSYQFSFS